MNAFTLSCLVTPVNKFDLIYDVFRSQLNFYDAGYTTVKEKRKQISQKLYVYYTLTPNINYHGAITIRIQLTRPPYSKEEICSSPR